MLGARQDLVYEMTGKNWKVWTIRNFSGFSSKWIKRGEYYYYTSILKRKETVDLFQSVHIPTSWKKEHELQKLGLDHSGRSNPGSEFHTGFQCHVAMGKSADSAVYP